MPARLTAGFQTRVLNSERRIVALRSGEAEVRGRSRKKRESVWSRRCARSRPGGAETFDWIEVKKLIEYSAKS